MPERFRNGLVAGVIVILAVFVIGAVLTADPPAADRAEAIGSRIRCPVCQGESIADSPSRLAQDMMALVRTRIDEGMSDQQVVDEILAAYTDAQLLDPPLSVATVALWGVPGAALIAGTWMLAGRRRSRAADAAPEPEQARRDLEELERQVAAGEIDEWTGARLRETYRSELAVAERSDGGARSGVPGPDRSGLRTVAGAAIVVLGLGVAVGLVGLFVQERDDGPLQGIAAPGDGFDPDAYSNETLEAVIASFEDDPDVADQLRLMRFRLAERYFEDGDYRKAFPHYQEIMESGPPPRLGSAVYTRVAWIVWVGNDETDLAMSLLDRALEEDPGNAEAAYVKGQVLWCGMNRAGEAVPLFEEVLAGTDLEPAVREQVESDLAAATAGEPCA